MDAAEAHMGMAYAKWYASRGAAGKKPEDPEMIRAIRPVPRSVRRVGRKSGRERERDLEDRRRADVEHRHGRAVTGRDGRAHREEQHGQRSRPNGERTACPDAAFVDAGHVLLQVTEVQPPACVRVKRAAVGRRRARLAASGRPTRHGVAMVNYIVRRLMLAVLTVWAISVLSFMIIHLPPGDYVTSYIASMSASGSAVSEGEAAGAARTARPRQAHHGSVREVDGPHPPGQFRHGDGMGTSRVRRHRRPSDLDHGHLRGGDHIHLGHRIADRHLLRGLPLLVPGLRVHVDRLHRARHSRLPAGAGGHVRRLRLVRCQRRRPLFARFHRGALEHGKRCGTSPSTCRSRPSSLASPEPRS